MKKILIHLRHLFSVFISIIVSVWGRLLILLGFIDRFVLVRMDGGICSQMHFYMIGQIFKQQGYSVKYELNWFDDNGLDLTGKFCRNFDLLKAFPYLDFQKANRLEQFFYKAFKYSNNYFDKTNSLRFSKLSPPVYLTGYFRDPIGLYCDMRSVFSVDYSILNKSNLALLEIIQHKESPVAIHVRRGDLSVFNSAYGAPVDANYFNHSIAYIESKVGRCYYYIFSDEPEWVRDNLINVLNVTDNYYIVDINGSEKGYLDLFLIAACKHQITSKGSLGKYGAFICTNPQNIITVYDDEYERETWDSQHSNIVFVK